MANRLTRLGTLTYAEPFCLDPVQARVDVGVFFRSLRAALGGEPFPYAWVPEFHADGERLHLHFAAGRFIPRRMISEAWGKGFVHIKLLSDVPVGTGSLGESRRAAGYLGKYLSKAFEDPRISGRHRYDVAQGFQPKRVQVWGRSADHVLSLSSGLMGGSRPVSVWRSDDEPSWAGPPSMWAAWA